jgi:hypothetical protein
MSSRYLFTEYLSIYLEERATNFYSSVIFGSINERMYCMDEKIT